MKKVNWKTTTYKTGHEDFMIDIIECPDRIHYKKEKPEKTREAWLYRASTGIKIFIIGELEKYWNGQTVEQFAESIVDYIESNTLKCGNWYSYYDEDYLNYPENPFYYNH